MYALNLAPDGRCLSACPAKYAPVGAVTVQALPEGNLYEYRYADGAYIHEPLTDTEGETPSTLEDRVTALEEANTEMNEALEMILSGVTE